MSESEDNENAGTSDVSGLKVPSLPAASLAFLGQQAKNQMHQLQHLIETLSRQLAESRAEAKQLRIDRDKLESQLAQREIEQLQQSSMEVRYKAEQKHADSLEVTRAKLEEENRDLARRCERLSEELQAAQENTQAARMEIAVLTEQALQLKAIVELLLRGETSEV